MNTAIEAVPTRRPQFVDVDLKPSPRLRRHLLVSKGGSDYVSATLTTPQRKGLSSRSLAYNSGPLRDCSLMFPRDQQDDDVTLIVSGTHFPVTRKEAAKLQEVFGFRSWMIQP